MIEVTVPLVSVDSRKLTLWMWHCDPSWLLLVMVRLGIIRSVIALWS